MITNLFKIIPLQSIDHKIAINFSQHRKTARSHGAALMVLFPPVPSQCPQQVRRSCLPHLSHNQLYFPLFAPLVYLVCRGGGRKNL